MPAPKAARPVILIVEDDALVLLDAADMIQSAGYDVLEASNADEAIKILESRSDIEVIFTDIEMPGSMNGLRLAEAVRGRWPPIKIIATSGHFQKGNVTLPSGGWFLPKPYTSEQVTTALREVRAG